MVRSSVSRIRNRDRIISANAQNAAPSPYDRLRPRCHATRPRNPSTYFSNSHPRRLFPTPATPVTTTNRARPSAWVACSASLTARSSASRPAIGACRPSTRCAPPTAATTVSARNSRTGSALPFSTCSPMSLNATAACVNDRVSGSTHTDPGSAAVCTRAAVFTASPATMPSFVAPSVTATDPVTIPTRIDNPGAPEASPSATISVTRSSPARTARSASSSCETGTPHTAITASPMNFSIVPP